MKEDKLDFAMGLGVALVFLLGLGIGTALRNTDYDCNCTCFTPLYSFENQNNIQAAHSDFDYSKIINSFDEWGEVYGNSMQPTFFDGNIALAMNFTDDYNLTPGELVRYHIYNTDDCKSKLSLADRYNNGFEIHRVVSIYNDDNIVVAGDNNKETEVIRKCQITHIVTGILFK